jgi:6-bladed beta-propeller
MHSTRFLGLLVASTSLAAACASDTPRLATARVDTLPGGITRTISDAPTGWNDSLTAWRLVLEHEIQPLEGEEGELFDPLDLAMNEAGTVYVKDQKPSVIKVFDPGGRYLRSIGREGDGPGEFRTAFLAVRGDTLLTQDPQNSRVTAFNGETGAVIATWRSTCCYWYPVGLDGEGRLIVHAMGNPDSTEAPAQAIVRSSLDGSSIDTLWATERPRGTEKAWIIGDGKTMQMMMAVPFQPRDQHAPDPAGVLLTGWNGEYLIRTSRNGRDTTGLFGRAWTPEPVTDADRKALVEEQIRNQEGSGNSEEVLRAAMKPEYIPDVRTSWNSLEADAAGNRWIRLETKDTLRVHYDVFDPAGRWLGPVSVPASLWSSSYSRPAWGRDRVAVLGEDDDARPLVRVFRIVKPATR